VPVLQSFGKLGGAFRRRWLRYLRGRDDGGASRHGARVVAGATDPPRPTEADLLAKLDAARVRLREIVILRMKTGIPEETRRGLREAEAWWRGEVRLHFQVLERFREEQRRRRAERHFTL
jgi:hypothetical protein